MGASVGHTCVDGRLLRSAAAATSTASSSQGALETRLRQASAGFSPHAQPLAQQQRGPPLSSLVSQQHRAADLLPTVTSACLKVVEAVVFEATTSGSGIDEPLDSTESSPSTSLPGLIEARLRELGLLAAVMWLQAPSGMLFFDMDA